MSQGNDDDPDNQTVTITFKELNSLQSQIQELRSSNYDLEQREKRLRNEFEKLSTLYNNQEKDLQRANQAVQRSKDRRELLEAMEESERLQNTIEMMNSEHREQNQVLRKNLQMMYERTQELEKELEEKKTTEQQLTKRVTELEESSGRNEAKAERQAALVSALEDRLQNGTGDDAVAQEAEAYLGDDDVYHIPASAWRALHPPPPLTCTASIQTDLPANDRQADAAGDARRSEEEWNALHTELEDLRAAAKQWDKEKEHAQQQVDMWREKLRIRQERADERQEQLQDKIGALEEEVKRARSDRQDLTAQVANKESTISTLQQQLHDRDARITKLEPLAEDGRRLAHAGEERDSLRERLATAEREREEAVGRAHALETAAMSGAEQAEEAQWERDEALQEANEYSKRIKTLESKRKELSEEVNRLQDVVKRHQDLLERTERALLHEWVSGCVARGGLAASEQQAQRWHRFAQQRTQAEQRARAAESERHKLLEQIREMRVDQRISRKKADNMVRELRSQLKRERRERERVEASVSSGGSVSPSPSTSPRPSGDIGSGSGRSGSGATSNNSNTYTYTYTHSHNHNHKHNHGNYPSARRIPSISSESVSTAHTRRNSISSEASDISGVSDTNSTSPETLLHENNILVHRVTQMQMARWRLEQRNRVLEDTIKGLHEEIERKTEVIRHFVKRQQVGRLGADMDTDREERARWGGSSIMGSIFSGRKVSKTVSADMQAQMQKVLEETIVHNMELQKQIRILGDEVQRLLAENKGRTGDYGERDTTDEEDGRQHRDTEANDKQR